MIKAHDVRISFLIKALVGLLFVSKVSLGSILPLPQKFSYLIFQQGLHPYVNVFLCALLGFPLILLWLKVRDRNHLSGFYKLFVFFLMLVLSIQTLLQSHFVNSDESLILQIGALFSALFMIVIYGLVIPSLWSAKELLEFVQKWAGVCVIFSLVMLFIAGGVVFKGGRFVGIFKHIPHMVTCATVAFVFSLGTFISQNKLQHKIWSSLVLISSFIAIVLTGTRSSAAAALVAFIVTMIVHQTQTNQGRLFKFASLSFLISFALILGPTVYDYAHKIATGQTSLGGREAQDGIASRWEEVERGAEIFLEEPWLGHGLLSKFASGSDVDVSNYNALKDPHNIFVSAGVVGGWPLLVLSGVALILMFVGALKSLLSFDISKRQIAIYLLSHIPILVIYHVHLSIGGMADRLYWMVFGIVAVSSTRTGKL